VWDTTRIPIDEYAAIRRAQLRHRITPLAVTSLVLAVALVLILTGRALLAVLVVPMAGYAWGQFIRPARRHRRERELSELPRWEIKAE